TAATFASSTPTRVAPPAVCAMQYWHPAARLDTCAISRLRPRSTLLSGSQTAAVICDHAFTILGLRCMISRLFGTKPMDLLDALNWSFIWGLGCSGAKRGEGFTRWSMAAPPFWMHCAPLYAPAPTHCHVHSFGIWVWSFK